MTRMVARRSASVVLAVVSVLVSTPALAIDASNVLVLYNAASTDGQQIASYYSQVHPGTRLLGLTGLPTTSNPEYITADDYLNIVRPQVLSALTPSTDVIVTTKGLPLRVDVTESLPTGYWTYTDPSGTLRQVINTQRYSSLESELTSIKTVSTWQMMADQSYAIPGQFSANPYYQAAGSFNSASYGMYLSSRLDGYSVSDVLGEINRAQHAFIGPANSPNGPFHFLVDNDPTKTYAPTMANLVTGVLNPHALPVTYDNTTAFVGTTTGPLIGYDSYGKNQASTPNNYILNSLNVTLANGAVFNTWESYNAYSFTAGGYSGFQGQLGQWIQKGGTAAMGNVEEPGASPSRVANEDQLFQMLLDGKTLGEAAWSSLRELGFVNTVVGDPLMTWHTLTAGDVNMDGRVDIADLAVLAAHWNQHVTPGGASWTSGDLNSDGVVNLADLSVMGAHWGQVSSWSTGPANTAGLRVPQLGRVLATPEPSSFLLALLAAAALAALGSSSRRRGR